MERAVSLLFFFVLAHSAAARDPTLYQMQFPPAPSSAAGAIASFPTRAEIVITEMACARNYDFLLREKKADATKELRDSGESVKDPEEFAGEDEIAYVIGKMQWLVLQQTTHIASPPAFCEGSFKTVPSSDDIKNYWPGLPTGRNDLQSFATSEFGTACNNEVDYSLSSATGALTTAFKITPACLRREVNVALSKMTVVGHLGSTGLPCYGYVVGAALGIFSDAFGATSTGEWDVSVRDLVRVIYIDNHVGGSLLDSSVRTHVTQDLITVSGPHLDPTTYSWTACGDQEESTGSAEDRADEDNFVADALGDIGDIWDWLTSHWIVLLLLAGVTGVFASPGFILKGPLTQLGALATAAGLLAGFVRVPETENHLLNIETSRYLNNQYIIETLEFTGGADPSDLIADQVANKRWLLDRMRCILTNDFDEYNAIPYQRYSLTALLNLADFAFDKDVQTAARMTLDFAFAKAAAGSLESRRFVPFRRRMEVVLKLKNGQDVFDQVSAADQQVALLLLYTGQTQQLFGDIVSEGAADKMIYAATSAYQPPAEAIAAAIDKSTPYFQTIRHDGVEIYSSAPGYLITAGGIETAAKNKVDVAADVPMFYDTDDKGAALPTTIMFPARLGSGFSTLPMQLRIEGPLHDRGGDGQKVTYDNNLCVYRGFACGMNIEVPAFFDSFASASGCSLPAPPGYPAGLKFYAVANCEASDAKTVVVVYTGPCPDDLPQCRNQGFIEAVSDPLGGLAGVIAKVTAANAPAADFPCRYTWHTYWGDTIEYDCGGSLHGSGRTGVEVVNGVPLADLSDWAGANGELIEQTQGQAFVKISFNGHGVNLNFLDAANPKREIF